MRGNKIGNTKKDLQNLKIPIIALFIYSVFMQIIFKTICPLKALTGISCPACGLTHATFYMFTGQFKKAFQSNETVILWWFSIFLFLVDRYIHKFKINVFPVCFIITGIVTILRYVFVIEKM